MTDLDRRVAELRGWRWDEVNEWWTDTDGAVLLGSAAYLPSTNLWQAFALWDEARPEGWQIFIRLTLDGNWLVARNKPYEEIWSKIVSFTDLPCAITQSWVTAMEGT